MLKKFFGKENGTILVTRAVSRGYILNRLGSGRHEKLFPSSFVFNAEEILYDRGNGTITVKSWGLELFQESHFEN